MTDKITAKAFDIQDPAMQEPNGDRYLVEEIEVENTVYVGGQKLLLPESSNHEEKRGWKLCRVIACGNGHRLEIDQFVPMFYVPGDVVYVERFTGRELKLQAQAYWIISQVDVLMKAPQVADLLATPELVPA